MHKEIWMPSSGKGSPSSLDFKKLEVDAVRETHVTCMQWQ